MTLMEDETSNAPARARRLIASEGMSLDGRFADADGGLEWQSLGPSHAAYSIELLDQVDTLLFGRTTYELMRSFWPTEHGIAHSPQIAERMNAHAKLIASHRPLDSAWENTRPVDGELVEAVKEIKSQPGKDIALLGSASVLAVLTAAGLLDELRITLNPVVLAAGPALFAHHTMPQDLRLTANRPLDDGAMLLVYHPRNAA